MCLASNSRVAAACRSPAVEPSDVFISSHAASNAEAKIFIDSRMGLDSKKSHWGTAITAYRTAKALAVGRGQLVHGAVPSVAFTQQHYKYTSPY